MLLAGLFGLKQCGGKDDVKKPTAPTAPVAVTAPVTAPVVVAAPVVAPAAAAPAPAPAPAKAPLPTASAGSALLKVNFATGSAVIPAASNANLDAFAAELKKSGAKGEISGHTDNVGDAALNTKLSDARAKAVADYLAKHGVAATALTAKGYGSDKSIADNKTVEGKLANRRVEFTPAK